MSFISVHCISLRAPEKTREQRTQQYHATSHSKPESDSVFSCGSLDIMGI